MALSDVFDRVLGFLRVGYPQGVPTNDYVPLLALLRRRLTDEEVLAVASELMSRGDGPVPGTDARVAITKVTDEMASHRTPTGRRNARPTHPRPRRPSAEAGAGSAPTP
jgi:hypothetical protein